MQEEGVDEPDLVKTNGNTVFAVANGKLRAVDVAGAKPRLLDSLALEPGLSHELLLHGDRLLVLSRGGYWIEPLPAVAARIAPYQPANSVLAEIDVSDPAKLRLVRTLTLDGSYVAARLVGSAARIVVAAQLPAALPFKQPTDGSPEAIAAAERAERGRARALEGRELAPVLPDQARGREARQGAPARPVPPRPPPDGVLRARHAHRPHRRPDEGPAAGRLGRGDDGRPDRLRVAGEPLRHHRALGRPAGSGQADRGAGGAQTEIHKFDISSPMKTHYRGSGRVSGYLLSQWSLSEYRGVLRVVSTESPAWWGSGGETESFLTTLRPSGGNLVQAGRVGGLGKGERVYSVRFAGDTGYVVTFRQVDPLFTLDLSRPEQPRVLGELKIPGYSAYLHPIGEDLLLGVGQDVDEKSGRPLGTQLSIFDVSDLRKPTRLHTQHLGQGWSEAEHDHHAFLFWPRTGLVMIPFEQRAVGFRVGRSRGIDPLGRVEHDQALCRSAARSSSATACSRSRRTGSRRAASRRSPSAAGLLFLQRSRRLGAAPIGARRKENHA